MSLSARRIFWRCRRAVLVGYLGCGVLIGLLILLSALSAIGRTLLDALTAQAKASPRLRMNYYLRNSPEDRSQRMLNALEPGTVMPNHRHCASSETVVIIRGKIQWVFYDDDGNEAEDLVTVMYCNEVFDPGRPDTFFEKV